MKRNFNSLIVNYLAVVFSFLFLSGCSGMQKKNNDTPLPAEFTRSGLISSSTYQVMVTLENKNENDAKLEGTELAIEKATSLISQEVFIYRKLSIDGRRRIRKLVEEKGKVVMFQKTSEKIYSLVYQVNHPGLKKYLESIH